MIMFKITANILVWSVSKCKWTIDQLYFTFFTNILLKPDKLLSRKHFKSVSCVYVCVYVWGERGRKQKEEKGQWH